MPVIATLDDLDEEALMRILTEPKNALVRQYQRLFEMEDVQLSFAEESLRTISKKAIERKTGARGLRSIMEGILLDTMFELPSLRGVEEVVISSEVVEGKARPLRIYSDRHEELGTRAPDAGLASFLLAGLGESHSKCVGKRGSAWRSSHLTAPLPVATYASRRGNMPQGHGPRRPPILWRPASRLWGRG